MKGEMFRAPKWLQGGDPVTMECRYDPSDLAAIFPAVGSSSEEVRLTHPDGSEYRARLLEVDPGKPREVPSSRWQQFKACWFPRWLLWLCPVRRIWEIEWKLTLGPISTPE